MDSETVALIATLASLAVGLVGVAATLFVQGRRRQQRARAEAGGAAVAGDQPAEGSVAIGPGAFVVDRSGAGPTIIAPSGGTTNIYLAFPAYASPPPGLDVRGMPVEQALSLIDNYLEVAFRLRLAEVRITHGNKTTALGQAIRDALSRHPLVGSVSTPPPEEGGEDVTLVSIAG